MSRFLLRAAAAVSLAVSAFPASNDFLVPFWGSDLSPADTLSWRISLQLDQFTELDKDALRFPLDRGTDYGPTYGVKANLTY